MRIKNRLSFGLILGLFLCAAVACGADRDRRGGSAGRSGFDWPQWRGPARDDISAESGLLQKWPEGGPRRVWLVRNLGKGYGGPAVVGNRLYIMGTSPDYGTERLFCLDTKTGKSKWTVPIGKLLKNGWGDGPRATPTVDGNRVYA